MRIRGTTQSELLKCSSNASAKAAASFTAAPLAGSLDATRRDAGLEREPQSLLCCQLLDPSVWTGAVAIVARRQADRTYTSAPVARGCTGCLPSPVQVSRIMLLSRTRRRGSPPRTTLTSKLHNSFCSFWMR